jgi:chromosomal replication initiation ATPase DnaA
MTTAVMSEAQLRTHYAGIKARLYGNPYRPKPALTVVRAVEPQAKAPEVLLPTPAKKKRNRAKRPTVRNVVEFLQKPRNQIREISSVPAWKDSRINFNQHVIDYRRYLVNMEEHQDHRPTMEEITKSVLVKFPHLTVADLKGSSRCRDIVLARQIAQYRIRQVYGGDKSYPDIGRFFGGRDHSTIHHAVQKIERLMAAAE